MIKRRYSWIYNIEQMDVCWLWREIKGISIVILRDLIKMKIESIGKSLKEWDVRIYRGILTGLNEALLLQMGRIVGYRNIPSIIRTRFIWCKNIYRENPPSSITKQNQTIVNQIEQLVDKIIKIKKQKGCDTNRQA